MLLVLVVGIPEALLVYYFALNGVHHGEANPICGQHEIVPNSLVDVSMVGTFILYFFGPPHWIVEHRLSVALLAWLVLWQRPS